MVVLRGFLERLPVTTDDVAVEPETEASHHWGVDVFGFWMFGPGGKPSEVEVVVANGAGGAAAFDFEIFKEFGDEFGKLHT